MSLSSPTWRAGAAAVGAAAVVTAVASWLWFRRSAADESVAKAVAGGTLTTHPSSYSYLMQHVGERAGERALREQVQAQTRARMMGSPDEACFLRWLCELLNARRVVEVGTFRGTTTLQLARGVGAAGEVVALDIDARWLEAGGRAAWAAVGLAPRIRFVEGPAVESMRELLARGGAGAYDLVFIDADKYHYREYYELALQLVRVGGVVAVDNVLWGGRAEAPAPGDLESEVIHRLNDAIRADARVSAVMLGIADGVYLARKL